MTTTVERYTRIFIARGSGRTVSADRLPGVFAISPVTLGELRAGVLAAGNTGERAQRLLTLETVMDMELLPIDAAAAYRWAALRSYLDEQGR